MGLLLYFSQVDKSNQSFFRRKLVNPLLVFLKQGISPDKLALTVAFGAIWGTFPILGTNTIICIGTALAFKLNQAAIQIVNYAMYPIQLLLIIPFIKAGLWILGNQSLEYSFEQIWEILKNDKWRAVETLGNVIWAGVIGWILFAIPVFLICWLILKPVFTKIAEREK